MAAVFRQGAAGRLESHPAFCERLDGCLNLQPFGFMIPLCGAGFPTCRYWLKILAGWKTCPLGKSLLPCLPPSGRAMHHARETMVRTVVTSCHELRIVSTELKFVAELFRNGLVGLIVGCWTRVIG